MHGATDFILIEDNPNDAEMVLRAMKKRFPASRCTWLKDGADALSQLLGQGTGFPDCLKNCRFILLDLKLPFVDGIDVLKQLKASPKTATIPIIMLTSSREDSDIERCYRNGANSFVVKPVGFDDFQRTVTCLADYWFELNQHMGL